MDLIFEKSIFNPHEELIGRSTHSGELSLYHLGKLILTKHIHGDFNLGRVANGGYTVVFESENSSTLVSAIEVLEDPLERVRYGFVSEFSENVNVKEYIDWAKRLHLTGIQFYDWAYKHEYLISPNEIYGDPLGNQISKNKIKELIDAYEKIGVKPFGYVAVYAVDRDGWNRWKNIGLFNSVEEPYKLGENFLWLVDPASPDWINHFIEQLQHAVKFGFNGFHLDQYGWPKLAFKSNGDIVDLSKSFDYLLESISNRIDNVDNIFNNVNNFPSWVTSRNSQLAIYIEVWDPHSDYQELALLVAEARAYDPNKPIILSAYLKPFGSIENLIDEQRALAALQLAFASIVSGGASHLISGGNGRILYDPYYVKNYVASPSLQNSIEDLFSFSVSAGDLIHDKTRQEVTKTFAFGINDEIKFESDHKLLPNATPGAIWTRIYLGENYLTFHFINLLDQSSIIWDEPKIPVKTSSKVKVCIKLAGLDESTAVSSNLESLIFQKVETHKNGEYLEFFLEVSSAWTIFNINLLAK